MKSVQALHADIEWRRMRDSETYYALRDGPRLAKNWAIYTLAKAGELTAEQVKAAMDFATLCERAQGQGRREGYDRVDGGLSDPHARNMDLAKSKQKRDRAFWFVVCNVTSKSRLKTRQRTMQELFSYPHMSLQQMREVTDESHGKTVRRVTLVLDLLEIYFRRGDRLLDKRPDNPHDISHAAEVSIAPG